MVITELIRDLVRQETLISAVDSINGPCYARSASGCRMIFLTSNLIPQQVIL